MIRTRTAWLGLLFAGVAAAQDPTIPPAEPAPAPTTVAPSVSATPAPAVVGDRNYVALVIGISTYANLPKEVHLDFARSDAATVAQALRDDARFDQVFLLRDSEATKEAIRDTLRTKVAQFVGPNDVFLLYFVGHGVGADLGTPVLLAYDSTLANGQEDGLELSTFARDIQTFAPAGTSLIITDAIHRNQLDGIYFYGPSADQWPAMNRGTMVLSSSAAASPAKDGAFGQVFATAIGGGADSDNDGKLRESELVAFLAANLAPSGQNPVATGDYDATSIISQEVTRRGVATYVTEGTQRAPEVIYPDIQISAAKFVWTDGAAQSVTCRDEPIVACSPSCYVRTFQAGPCQISAVMDGVQMTGEAIVVAPGKYDCMRKGGNLVCTGPSQQ